MAVRGRLLLEGRLAPGVVVFAEGRILEVLEGAAVSPDRLPALVVDAAVISPGLIDLQINGGFGFEVGADASALRALAARLPATGVTAFLPTLVSQPAARYPPALDAFAAARDAPGATPLGLHLEGPWLSAAHAGAHDRDAIEAATPALIDAAVARGSVRLVTLAPERPGALALIQRLRAQGIVVSLGHTDASFEELTAGIDAGASMVTHLYNAMAPFGHRAPGAVGAALTDPRVVTSLIADGIHVHAAALRLARAAKGREGLVLVTDAVAPMGLGPGRFALGEQAIVSDGAAARLVADRTTLAGSTLTLDQAIRSFARLTGAPFEEALHLATLVPARLLGLASKGRLAAGADADLVLWSDTRQIEATYFGRDGVHRAAAPGEPPG